MKRSLVPIRFVCGAALFTFATFAVPHGCTTDGALEAGPAPGSEPVDDTRPPRTDPGSVGSVNQCPDPDKIEFDKKDADGLLSLFQGANLDPKTRAVFNKTHACLAADFRVLGDLPEELQVGLFAQPKLHKAWVRLSTDPGNTGPDDRMPTGKGFAIKLLDALGDDETQVLHDKEDPKSHDFLLQNHPVFFADTAKDMLLLFTDPAFGKANPQLQQILADMEKPVRDVLDIQYWSITPYKFGETFAKYTVVPVPSARCSLPVPNTATQLGERVARDLKAPFYCFEFRVQLRKPNMPLDCATVEWSPEESVPVTVARLRIGPQDVPANAAECEHRSFTAWHAKEAHRPVGSINEARKVVYEAMAAFRRLQNPQPQPEEE